MTSCLLLMQSDATCGIASILVENNTRIATIGLLLSGCKRHQSLHHLHVFARGLILPKQIFDPKLL